MKTEIISKASRLAHTAGLQIKKHSPEILLVAGIAGTVASTIMACKATTKAGAVIEEKNKQLQYVDACLKTEDIEYTEEDRNKDLTIIYTQTGVNLFKLYAPSIAVGALSIACIVSGHNILKKRNVALAAAYAVVDKGFKNYRKNVVDRFGEELDKELRYNIKAKEVENVVKNEDGTETVEKKVVNVVDEDQLNVSEYAKFFDETCTNYTKDPEWNLKYLKMQHIS